MAIEVESRGPVPKGRQDELIKRLGEIGTFKKEKNRILIDYSTFIESEGLEGRTRDIRVRTTNGVVEIITKLGKWGADDARKEYSLIVEASFDDVVQTYHALGYSKGVLCVRNSQIFDVEGVEVAVVEVPGHSYFFEAEIEVEDGSHETEVRAKIKEILGKLDLLTYSDDEFFAYIKQLNDEVNEVFDAHNESETYFADRFGV